MHLLKLTGMLSILFLNFSSGQEEQTAKHPIDVRVEQCLAIDSNQTTIGMITCIQTAMAEWDAEMNKFYKLLLETLKTDGQEKLRTAQREWLDYREKESEFINTMYGNKEGTMWKIIAADSQNNIVRQRAIELKSYYTTFTFD